MDRDLIDPRVRGLTTRLVDGVRHCQDNDYGTVETAASWHRVASGSPSPQQALPSRPLTLDP